MESFCIHHSLYASVSTRRKGFTLIELLVVFTIISVVASIVFTSQSSFNKTFILTNTAYDVALSLRESQTYGLGSRAVSSASNVGYGLHFDSNSPKSFTLFADVSPTSVCNKPDCQPGDGVYTHGADSLVRTYTIGNGITLDYFCAYTSAWVCTNGAVNSLDIVFARPNPTPNVHFNGTNTATDACLRLASSQGTFRYVKVSASGQINANAPACP
jgi:prepilin-type N-terminal cleavage/methylation domain-containing protein